MTDKMTKLGFKEVAIGDVELNPFKKISSEWFLVTAGDESDYNTMTAGWGGFGFIWGKPVANVVIRPQRYTKEYVDKNDIFTMCFFPEDKKQALVYCGRTSGRDFPNGEKAKNAGLTAMSVDGSTAFEEANLIFVCRKLYASPLVESDFLDSGLAERNYPDKDYHMAYTAEITAVYKK